MSNFNASTLLLLGVVSSTMMLITAGSYINSKNIGEVEEVVDKVEQTIGKVVEFTSKNSKPLTAFGGGIIYLYGAQFPLSLLIWQAIGATGLSGIKKSLNELLITFKATRKTLKEELPGLLAEKEAFMKDAQRMKDDLKVKIDLLQLQYKEKTITAEDLKLQVSELKSSMKEIMVRERKMNAISNSFSRIYSAINPESLQTTVNQLYIALMSAVAAASNKLSGQITLGIQLGQTLSERLQQVINRYLSEGADMMEGNAMFNESKELVQIFPDCNQQWVKNVIKGISTALGIFVVRTYQQFSYILSATTMGSKIMVDSIQDILDPQLEKMGLPLMRDSPVIVTSLQSGLIALGVMLNLKVSLTPSSMVLKLVLAPMIGLESWLLTVFPGDKK